MNFSHFPKQMLLVCVCLCALTGQAIADSLSEATNAFDEGNYTKAIKLFRPLAKQGDAFAQSMLGTIYYIGQGVSVDYKEAVKWCRLAAEQGDAGAQSFLGLIYFEGKAVPQDYKEAVKWYQLAAEQGNASAQYMLGEMYENGEGVLHDYKEKLKWYRLAAKQGNVDAQLKLGGWYSLWGALYYVGGRSLAGQSLPQHPEDYPKEYLDSNEAMKWYRLAAEQGNSIAQYELGGMYKNGDAVPQDYKEAVKWYRLAAEQGAAYAQKSLGHVYDDGMGVPQDYVLAYMWTNIAAVNADAREFQNIINYRDSIAKKMTAQQIADAQELARKCTINKFKGC